jgi:hypothetical protein
MSMTMRDKLKEVVDDITKGIDSFPAYGSHAYRSLNHLEDLVDLRDRLAALLEAPDLPFDYEIRGHGDTVLRNVFNGVGIPTDAGEFGIAQRDSGLEIVLDGELLCSLQNGRLVGVCGSTKVAHTDEGWLWLGKTGGWSRKSP